MISKVINVLLLVVTAVLFVFSARNYLGTRSLGRYKILRAAAPSIERAFPALEATLKKSIAYSENPVLYQELGRLYIERALGEIKFGGPEKREFYLDLALDALSHEIRLNPLDAWAYHDLSKAWMLYNYPLLTYAEKARFYCRNALKFYPANEFLNLSVLVTFLTQWDDLTGEEKAFAFKQTEKMALAIENFVPRLRLLWLENMKDEERLTEILSEDQPLWEKIKGNFKEMPGPSAT